jgi:hypothetical protein
VFAASATAGALLWLKDDEGIDRVPLHVPGLLLVAGGLFSLVFGFSHADTTAWRNPFTVGLRVAGVVLLVAFAYFETWAEPAASAAGRAAARRVTSRSRPTRHVVGAARGVDPFRRSAGLARPASPTALESYNL